MHLYSSGNDAQKARNAGSARTNALYWAVGILLVLTLFSTWLASGIFAKYLISDQENDISRVAGTGLAEFGLFEHKANETYKDSGLYLLDTDDEVRHNEYEKVLPGVDVPKDPFIRLAVTPEVDFELYLYVRRTAPFPDDLRYTMEDVWQLVEQDEEKGYYKYQYISDGSDGVVDGVFKAGRAYDFSGENVIPVLVGNILYVDEHYFGKGEAFKLDFTAELIQVD